MVKIESLVWDEWNREHIKRHHITIDEVEEICQGKHKEIRTYKRRFLLTGKTKIGRILAIAISPEDRNGKPYEKGIYYVITAYEKEEL